MALFAKYRCKQIQTKFLSDIKLTLLTPQAAIPGLLNEANDNINLLSRIFCFLTIVFCIEGKVFKL